MNFSNQHFSAPRASNDAIANALLLKAVFSVCLSVVLSAVRLSHSRPTPKRFKISKYVSRHIT